MRFFNDLLRYTFIMGRVRSALRRYMVLAVVLAISISLTLVTFVLARGWEANRAHSAFRGIASDRVNAINEGIKDEILKLDYLRSFYIANFGSANGAGRLSVASTPDLVVFGAEFRSLVRDAYMNDSEIDLLAYAPRILALKATSLTTLMRADGARDFQITQKNGAADITNASVDAFYYPVIAVEPASRYPMMLGFDIWSDQGIRQMLLESAANLRPEAAAPTAIRNGTGEISVIWMGVPLAGPANDTSPAGFALLRLRIDRLVENALSGLNPAGIDLFVYDAALSGPDALIYTHPSRTRERSIPVTSAEPREEVPYQWSTTIRIGQRQWRIEARPAPAFIRAHTYWLSWIVLGAGLFSTALLAGFVLGSLRRAQHVEEIVGERTSELSEEVARHRATEESLQIAHHDLTARMDTIHRRTREIELLSEMGDLLQTCRSTVEAYEVVVKYAQQLFPSDRGALYTFDETHKLLDRVSTWGDWTDDAADILPDECWALRRGKMHVVQSDNRNLVCDHVRKAEATGSYVCLPLIALGETISLLHLQMTTPGIDLSFSSESREYDDSRQRLVSATGEHAAMAFANLKLQETLRQQSIRDPLTGLFNRRYMEESLDRELHRARRTAGRLGVVMMDIDHFKKFNDTYGHEAGDLVLRAVGTQLLKFVRAEDIPCRFGGEELVMILPGATLADSVQKAEAFRRSIEMLLVEYVGQKLPEITISLGVAAFSTELADGTAILGAADAALYRAKKAGRNRVESSGGQDTADSERNGRSSSATP